MPVGASLSRTIHFPQGSKHRFVQPCPQVSRMNFGTGFLAGLGSMTYFCMTLKLARVPPVKLLATRLRTATLGCKRLKIGRLCGCRQPSILILEMDRICHFGDCFLLAKGHMHGSSRQHYRTGHLCQGLARFEYNRRPGLW